MLVKREPTFIQSTPPTTTFVHHASFASLRAIHNQGCLRSEKIGISVTTDPGRFLSPMPMFGMTTVDGFVEMSAERLYLAENLLIPCLYRCFDDEVIEWAAKIGHRVFEKEEIPPEYKYILSWCIKNDIFLRENEWIHLGEHLYCGEDYKVYIHPKLYKRFLNSPKLHRFTNSNNVFKLSDHPLLRKE